MKCDEFLGCRETGSPLVRLQARVHAWRCAKCAAAQKRLIELQNELARPAALTPFHRRVWERTAAEALPAPKWHLAIWPRLAVAAGTAAIVIVCIALSTRWRDQEIVKEDVPPPGMVQPSSDVQTIALRMAPGELAVLEDELKNVSADLDRLAEQATLIEVRQVIGELTATYRPLGPNDS